MPACKRNLHFKTVCCAFYSFGPPPSCLASPFVSTFSLDLSGNSCVQKFAAVIYGQWALEKLFIRRCLLSSHWPRFSFSFPCFFFIHRLRCLYRRGLLFSPDSATRLDILVRGGVHSDFNHLILFLPLAKSLQPWLAIAIALELQLSFELELEI